MAYEIKHGLYCLIKKHTSQLRLMHGAHERLLVLYARVPAIPELVIASNVLEATITTQGQLLTEIPIKNA